MTQNVGTQTDILKVLYAKWLQDHTGERLRYPSKCCHWENVDGKRTRIPDDEFDEWVGTLSRSGFNECVDSLEVGGLIDLYDTGLDVYYVVTTRGLGRMAELQRGAVVPEPTLSS